MLRRRGFVVQIALFVTLVAPAALAQTQLGSAFTYQGLLESGGFPVTGIYDIRFSLWDSAGNGSPPTGGTQISGTICSDNVNIVDGLFAATLDFGAAAFNADARW